MPEPAALSNAMVECLSSRHFLIADDSKAIREYLHQLLNSLGFHTISEAEDGNVALRIISSNPVDILFCDLAMPGMDGVELLRMAAQYNPDLAVIPISSLEARLRFGVAQMAHELGLTVLGIVGKPFQQEQLIQALAAYPPCNEKGSVSLDGDFSQDDLAEALKARRLNIHYQPQISVADGRILGFESLVRMKDKAGNLIPPGDFIELSESTGQIHRLSHMIIEGSLRRLALWSRLGHDFNISINFSARILSKLDLPEHVEAIARNNGIPTSRITIELTETQLKTGPELYDVMSRLRMKGFGLSIDDFGTGDSSLARLRSMPFTELKIDQEFVKGCTDDTDLQTIITNSISLGHELGMLVVAEGVQTMEEWDYLKAAGCDIAQGYLISPPLDEAAVVPWTQRWRKLHAS